MWQIWVSIALALILFILGLLKSIDVVFWGGNLAILILLLWYIFSQKRK